MRSPIDTDQDGLTSDEDDRSAWGSWANTGNVDPVLARMLHMLRHCWRGSPRPDLERSLSMLEAAIADTRVDDALSRRRALFVADGALRRDLPRILRLREREGMDPRILGAASNLEHLSPLVDSGSVSAAIHQTFHLESLVSEVERRMVRYVWEVARNAEGGIVSGRIYQLGTAAVYACKAFANYHRDLIVLNLQFDWATSCGELARQMAIRLVTEAVCLRRPEVECAGELPR